MLSKDRIIGRGDECSVLEAAMAADEGALIVVYGRRRIGKTFLIENYFEGEFAFRHLGQFGESHKQALSAFRDSLVSAGYWKKGVPRSWTDAFARLKELLESDRVIRERVYGQRIVFIDEFAWIAQGRNTFYHAFCRFWNEWGHSCQDLIVVICGSATSWMVENFVYETGAMRQRTTFTIPLAPFNMGECYKYCHDVRKLSLSAREIVEAYKIFGGVPQYYSSLYPEKTLDENIDALYINGALRYELDLLLEGQFKNAVRYKVLLGEIAAHPEGVAREFLRGKYVGKPQKTDFGDVVIYDEDLVRILCNLERSQYIQMYTKGPKDRNGFCYQVIDPFIRFAYSFLMDRKVTSWKAFKRTGRYRDWKGDAFELLCLWHARQIQQVLGFDMSENPVCFPWRSKRSSPAAQIDLVIARSYGEAYICEMKDYTERYKIDRSEAESIARRQETYAEEMGLDITQTHVVIVTSNGVVKGKNYRELTKGGGGQVPLQQMFTACFEDGIAPDISQCASLDSGLRFTGGS